MNAKLGDFPNESQRQCYFMSHFGTLCALLKPYKWQQPPLPNE